MFANWMVKRFVGDTNSVLVMTELKSASTKSVRTSSAEISDTAKKFQLLPEKTMSAPMRMTLIPINVSRSSAVLTLHVARKKFASKINVSRRNVASIRLV